MNCIYTIPYSKSRGNKKTKPTVKQLIFYKSSHCLIGSHYNENLKPPADNEAKTCFDSIIFGIFLFQILIKKQVHKYTHSNISHNNFSSDQIFNAH